MPLSVLGQTGFLYFAVLAGARNLRARDERHARRRERRKRIRERRERLLQSIVCLGRPRLSHSDAAVDHRVARSRPETPIDEQDASELVQPALQGPNSFSRVALLQQHRQSAI